MIDESHPDYLRERIATLERELAEAQREARKFRQWMNCGGAPTGKKCAVDGHEIYGPFFANAEECPDTRDRGPCFIERSSVTNTIVGKVNPLARAGISTVSVSGPPQT